MFAQNGGAFVKLYKYSFRFLASIYRGREELRRENICLFRQKSRKSRFFEKDVMTYDER